MIFVFLQKNWHTTYNSYCESLFYDIHHVCNFVCGYVNYRASVFFLIRHIYICSIQGFCNFRIISVNIAYIYRGFNIICGCINYREIVATIVWNICKIALHLRYLSELKSRLLKARLLNTPFVYSPFIFSFLNILFIEKI